MRLDEDRENRIEKILFWLLFSGMAVYYGFRMFALTPWYDELYTYYCFISRGPIYAAIHWPLPNNHVGYSVLSGFLDMLGNPYIGLRGVSYLCALANMILLRQLGKKSFQGLLPLLTVLLYISMELVNQLAVQGRGYTLGVTCFLSALLCIISLCREGKETKRLLLCYIGSLTLALYAVSSNVYWVVPLCIGAGLYLLTEMIRTKKENGGLFQGTYWKRLLRLILASITAALCTVLLYAVIWLAIGSNLLVKEEGSAYYGLGHMDMIGTAPFTALKRGMDYMLATPYIQSEERAGFLGRLLSFFLSLMNYYFSPAGKALLVICVLGSVLLLVKVWRQRKGREDKNLLLELVLLCEIWFVPLCLLIQCKRPYYRVFTYGGAVLALFMGALLQELFSFIHKKQTDKRKQKLLSGLISAAVICWCGSCFLFFDSHGQYGLREYEIQDALAHADVREHDSYVVTDCDQEYLLYFLYGIRCENRQIEGADMVILDKRMLDAELDSMVWEFYHYYETIPWTYIEENMDMTYENNDYVVYTLKEEKENEK